MSPLAAVDKEQTEAGGKSRDPGEAPTAVIQAGDDGGSDRSGEQEADSAHRGRAELMRCTDECDAEWER